MSKTARRVVLAVLGGGLLVLLGATALSWPSLERRWFLYSLERDPTRLEKLLLSTSAPVRGAVEDFLDSPSGQHQLLELMLAELDRTNPDMGNRGQLDRMRRNPVYKGAFVLRDDGITFQTWTGTTGHSSYSVASRPTSPERRRRILELLPRVAGLTHEPSGLRGLQIQVRLVTKDGPEPPSWPEGRTQSGEYPPGAPDLPAGSELVTYFRVVEVN